MTPRPLPLVSAFAILLTSGLVHGMWTQRWQSSLALEEACHRLHTVPFAAGEWTAANLEVDPAPYRQARAAGFWVRRYSRQGDGAFTVILMCGRPGHMAVHTPDICYPGAGYDMVGSPTKKTLTASTLTPGAELWSARFRLASRTSAASLCIYWTWTADGVWQAPSSPRWTFGGEPLLYKLYIVRETDAGSAEGLLFDDFVRQLLIGLERSLFVKNAES